MSVKTILILKGSPRRRGSTAKMVERLIAGAHSQGAIVESIELHGLDIRPCDACDYCRENEQRCVIDDAMQTIYPKLRSADVIVLASPIYWFTLSAQIKLCIDRWYALGGTAGHALAGKDFVLLLAYGDSDPYSSGAVNAIRTVQDMVRYLDGNLVDILYGSDFITAAGWETNPLLEQAHRLGQKLAGGR